MKWNLSKLLGLLLLFFLAITGCKDRTTSFNPDDDPTLVESSFGEATMGENTTVIPEETLEKLESVSEDGTVFTFTSSDAAIDNLQEGSIIVMGISPNTPMGALRKVDQKNQTQNSEVTIHTSETTFEEAFENLELTTTTIELDPTQVDSIIYKVPSLGIRSKMTATTHPKLADLAFSLPFEQIFYQDPENPEQQLKLSGEINMNPSFDLGLKIRGFKLQYLQLLMLNELDTDLIVTSEISREIENEYIIFQYWFTPIAIGPVVITPVFNIPLGIEGSANVGIKPELNAKITSAAGIRYESNTWEPIANFENIDFTANMPMVDVNASLKAYVGPRFDFFIYGVAGPYAILQGYGEATVDVNRNPTLQIHGGVEAKAGVRIAIFSNTIASHEFPELFSWRDLIYEAGVDQIEISTMEVTDITATTAVSGGEIINDGGETISAKGVCWSTNQQPDLLENCTDDGSGIESFTSEITGLASETNYFVRAYAINNADTAYGQQVTFTTGSMSSEIVLKNDDGSADATISWGGACPLSDNLADGQLGFRKFLISPVYPLKVLKVQIYFAAKNDYDAGFYLHIKDENGINLLPTPYIVSANEVNLNDWWELDVSNYDITIESGKIEVSIFERYLPGNCPPGVDWSINGWVLRTDRNSSGNSLLKGPTTSSDPGEEFMIRIVGKMPNP